MIRILVVEDNPGDIHLLKLALQSAKLECELTVLDDGQEALDFAWGRGKHENTPVPDLVVLDLNVPKNDGLEVLEALRANPAFAEVPIAVLSSSSSPRDIAKARRIGVERFIAKPPDLEEYMKIGGLLRQLVSKERQMELDVDEIRDVNYFGGGAAPGETSGVEITFKDGTTRVYEGAELPEALAILNHWTPPTA